MKMKRAPGTRLMTLAAIALTLMAPAFAIASAPITDQPNVQVDSGKPIDNISGTDFNKVMKPDEVTQLAVNTEETVPNCNEQGAGTEVQQTATTNTTVVSRVTVANKGEVRETPTATANQSEHPAVTNCNTATNTGVTVNVTSPGIPLATETGAAPTPSSRLSAGSTNIPSPSTSASTVPLTVTTGG